MFYGSRFHQVVVDNETMNYFYTKVLAMPPMKRQKTLIIEF